MAQATLKRSDLAFIIYSAIERPLVFGNKTFKLFKDAVKVKLQKEASSTKLPPQLQGTSSEQLFELVTRAYSQGRGAEIEENVVYHMMMQLLQKLAGTPHPQASSKLFAFARAMRHIHKPSYEFFRLNTLVGPHVETIKKFEAKTQTEDPILLLSQEGLRFFEPTYVRYKNLYIYTYKYIYIYIYIHLSIYSTAGKIKRPPRGFRLPSSQSLVACKPAHSFDWNGKWWVCYACFLRTSISSLLGSPRSFCGGVSFFDGIIWIRRGTSFGGLERLEGAH